ncbi:MAG: protoporphyrinogen oxidase [Acidobacteria bacterium]|nr:protoporphyrinogen oxidase [Acidobacteriota bacterium]
MTQAIRVGIVGAGISGLAGAYFLQKESRHHNLDLQITLLEKSPDLGGVIRSESVQGLLLEAGPECFISSKTAALRLAEELGLTEEIIETRPEGRQVFVVQSGKLEALPPGMVFLAPVRFSSFCSTSLISARGKLRAMVEPLIPACKGEPSVGAFLKRRLGGELYSKVAEPLVSAIYGGNVNELSAPSCLPELYQLEQKYGNFFKGLRSLASAQPGRSSPFLTFRRGMSTLTEQLASALEAAIYRAVGDLTIRTDERGYRVRGSNFEGRFDFLILATPAPAAADMVEPLSSELSSLLKGIHYSSTRIVYLAYRKSEFSHSLQGSGFVFPEQESQVLDACTWVSSKFEHRCPPDRVLLRCALHDGRRKRTFEKDESVVEKVHAEISRILSLSCQPIFWRIYNARKAMPQMSVGHRRRIDHINQILLGHPGLFLAGAYYGGVGVPDCVRRAEETTQRLLESATGFKIKEETVLNRANGS